MSAQRNAFEKKASEARELDLDGLPDTEIDILADSLQSFQVLQQLKLSNCNLNVQGFVLRLSWIQSLKKVGLPGAV